MSQALLRRSSLRFVASPLGMLQRCRAAAPLPPPPLLRRSVCSAANETFEVNRNWQPGSQRVGVIGMKCGMTQAWSATGTRVPITVIELQDVQVVKVRRAMRDGVNALQVAAGWQKRKRLRTDEANQYLTRGLPLKRYMREFNVTEDALLPMGTSLTVRHFVPGQYVDVQSKTKGKGFAGAMKRWGFKGQPASHGHSKSHRSIGSMGGAAGSMYATRVWKGKKMAGRMGGKNATMQGLQVWKVLPKYNILYLKGSVPGCKGATVRLRDTNHHKLGFTSPPPFPTFLPADAGDDEEHVELLCPEAAELPAAPQGKGKK